MNMKKGLVLEGGAMRGIYTAGVLDAFLEQNIAVDGVIGVSAGAVHGCSYVSGQHGRSIRYYLKYMKNPRFMSFRSLLKTGNVETGKPEYILLDTMDEIDYMRASASMPMVSQIVEVGGMKLLDGGVADSVPIRAFQQMGYEKNIVVLTRPAGYRKKKSSIGPAKWIYRKYPAFVKAMEERYKVYNETMDQIEEMEKSGEIFVIRPSRDPQIGRMEKNPEKVKAVYDLGYKDACAQMEALKAWL